MSRGTPSAQDLLLAVDEWIGGIASSLDARNVFLARVARGALGVVGRELADGGVAADIGRQQLSALLGHDGGFEELSRELSERLRGGSLDRAVPGLLDALIMTTENQLAIDQPKYRHGLGLPGAPAGSSSKGGETR